MPFSMQIGSNPEKSRSGKNSFFPFQGHLVIYKEILIPNSTKQAHFILLKLPCSARNRYYAVILTVMFFNGWFLCPGGKEFSGIR